MVRPLALRSQTLFFANTFFDYHPQGSSRERALFGGFFGAEYAFKPSWIWQFGLAFYQSTVFSLRGEEDQAPISNPNAINTWNYQYKIINRQLLLENKLSYSLQTRYRPYLLAGIGSGFNRTHGFQAIPQNSGQVATAIFTGHQNNSLIFNIGFGMDVDITKQLRLGGGYRFGYFGAYDLGKGTLDTGPGGNVFYLSALKSAQAFSQELLLQLTYIL
jgi:opacity protein-like surface antigen